MSPAHPTRLGGARTVRVSVPAGAYDVTIEPGSLAGLGAVVAGVAPNARAVLAVDRNIDATHGEIARASLHDAGYLATTVRLDAEERAKTLDTVRRMYGEMLAGPVPLDRGSPVVALGGGIIGDTAGFAAATFLRGLPLVQAPTTLLAMVDAAVGGKTGVNVELPGGGIGKNLVGAFWQPRAVLADPLVLSSLDPRDLRCGLAECVKYGMIADAPLLDWLADRGRAILDLEPASLAELIERCVRIKASIVEDDERETGRRALLNLGHTFAHAIESEERLGLRHGEAVSIGLVAAARCAVLTRRLDEGVSARVADLLGSLGLPLHLPAPASAATLTRAMQFDKKAIGGRVRLVLPDGPGSAVVTSDVPAEVVAAAWAHVGAGNE
jgi:3-dehydroquinate synthase